MFPLNLPSYQYPRLINETHQVLMVKVLVFSFILFPSVLTPNVISKCCQFEVSEPLNHLLLSLIQTVLHPNMPLTPPPPPSQSPCCNPSHDHVAPRVIVPNVRSPCWEHSADLPAHLDGMPALNPADAAHECPCLCPPGSPSPILSLFQPRCPSANRQGHAQLGAWLQLFLLPRVLPSLGQLCNMQILAECHALSGCPVLTVTFLNRWTLTCL